jgi:hypothetical protein
VSFFQKISAALDNFSNNMIIEDQWLQFVGYVIGFGGLIFKHPAVTYVGLGVSMAGWLYKKIYP